MKDRTEARTMVTPVGLASHLREIAREVIRGRVFDELELRHLLAVIHRCSLILGDFYDEREIGPLLAGRIAPPGEIEKLLATHAGWLESTFPRSPGDTPDQARAVADKCLYDVGLVGLDVYRGVNLSDLGVRSYRLASRSLGRLARDRLLRRFYDDNRWAHLPLPEEVRFLEQCADNFRCYAEILRHLRDAAEEEAVDAALTPLGVGSPPAAEPDGGGPAAPDGEGEEEPPPADDGEEGEGSESTREGRLADMERTLLFSQLDPERLRRDLRAVVIDQDPAVEALCDDLALRAAGTANRDRPPGYLFVGPTGVGKNHLVESLIRRLEAYWSVPVPFLLLEGPQYTYPSDINDLKGATRGFIRSDEEGMLSEFHERVRLAPLSVLVVDEVEKAHPQLTRFFLSILDRGTTTDNRGRLLDFTTTLIVFTSNIGFSRIGGERPIGYSEETVRRGKRSAMQREARRVLSPEFLNRLRMVEFRPLSRDSIERIFDLEFGRIRERFRTAQGIGIEVEPAARAVLIERGFSRRYGARHLVTVLEARLAVPISRRLLKDRTAPAVPASFLPYLREIRQGRRAASLSRLERQVREIARGRLPYRTIRVGHDGRRFTYRPAGSRNDG